MWRVLQLNLRATSVAVRGRLRAGAGHIAETLNEEGWMRGGIRNVGTTPLRRANGTIVYPR